MSLQAAVTNNRRILMQKTTIIEMGCTHCGRHAVNLYFYYTDRNGVKYRNYKCKNCGRNFSEKPRKFTFEDKQTAIDKFLETGSNLEAAKAIGSASSQIIRWRKEFIKYGLLDEEFMPRTNQSRKITTMVAE